MAIQQTVIEVVTEFKDGASAAVSGRASAGFDRYTASIDKMKRTLGGFNGNSASMGGYWNSYTQGANAALSATEGVWSKVKSIAGKAVSIPISIVDKVTSPLRKIYNFATSIKGVMTDMFAGQAWKASVSAPLQLADSYTSANLGFETLLRSAEKAKEMMNSLDEFARTTPFNTSDVIASSQRMMAMGWQADNIISDMKVIGDAAAATGKGTEGLNRIILALSQIKAKGKLSAEEMNQLAETGISARRYLSEGLGFGTGDAGMAAFTKVQERGGIGADAAISAIMEGMKEYSGMMEKTARETVKGLKAQISDTFEINIARKWGQGLQEGAKVGLGALVDMLDASQDKLAAVGEMLRQVGAEVSTFAAGALKSTIDRVFELGQSSEFRNADLFGKIDLAWDRLIAEPFDEWWNGAGGAKFKEIGGNIGKFIGEGILSGIGMVVQQFIPNLLGSLGNLVPGGAKASLGDWTNLGIAAFAVQKSRLVDVVRWAAGKAVSTGAVKTAAVAGAGAVTSGVASVGAGATIKASVMAASKLLATLGTTGALVGGTSVVAGINDLITSTRKLNAKQANEQATAGAAKIGLAGAGAGLGALVGSIIPVVGTAVGAGIGAGVGGLVGLLGGDSIGQWISDKLDGTQEIEDLSARLSESSANYASISERISETDTLIGRWQELNDLMESADTSSDAKVEAQREMADITARLCEMYPDLITQYEKENGLFKSRLDLLQQINSIEMKQADFDLTKDLMEWERLAPTINERIADSQALQEEYMGKIEALNTITSGGSSIYRGMSEMNTAYNETQFQLADSAKTDRPEDLNKAHEMLISSLEQYNAWFAEAGAALKGQGIDIVNDLGLEDLSETYNVDDVKGWLSDSGAWADLNLKLGQLLGDDGAYSKFSAYVDKLFEAYQFELGQESKYRTATDNAYIGRREQLTSEYGLPVAYGESPDKAAEEYWSMGKAGMQTFQSFIDGVRQIESSADFANMSESQKFDQAAFAKLAASYAPSEARIQAGFDTVTVNGINSAIRSELVAQNRENVRGIYDNASGYTDEELRAQLTDAGFEIDASFATAMEALTAAINSWFPELAQTIDDNGELNDDTFNEKYGSLTEEQLRALTPEEATQLQTYLSGKGQNLDPNGTFKNGGIDGIIGDVSIGAINAIRAALGVPEGGTEYFYNEPNNKPNGFVEIPDGTTVTKHNPSISSSGSDAVLTAGAGGTRRSGTLYHGERRGSAPDQYELLTAGAGGTRRTSIMYHGERRGEAPEQKKPVYGPIEVPQSGTYAGELRGEAPTQRSAEQMQIEAASAIINVGEMQNDGPAETGFTYNNMPELGAEPESGVASSLNFGDLESFDLKDALMGMFADFPTSEELLGTDIIGEQIARALEGADIGEQISAALAPQLSDAGTAITDGTGQMSDAISAAGVAAANSITAGGNTVNDACVGAGTAIGGGGFNVREKFSEAGESVRSGGSLLAGSLSTLAGRIANIMIPTIRVPGAVGVYAEGGIVDGAQYAMVGEDGPEAIIPLGSARKKRGLELWYEAGRRMGVSMFADGGFVGGNAELPQALAFISSGEMAKQIGEIFANTPA